jgi:glutamate dehydrogenase
VVHLHEYRLGLTPDQAMPIGDHLTGMVVDGLQGRAEVDGLNELVLRGGLSSAEVAIVRAYRRYRRQVGTSYSAEYTNQALAGHPAAVRAILEVFRLRFDPSAHATPDQVEAARAVATAACDAIERLDHDRIVRGILHLVDATLRTTVYVRDHDPERGWTLDADGQRVPVWAFKFDPSLVPDMPAPMPYREVFVASPAVEGIHLRGGPISRGGLRFSDRHDDLRTEILGLVKAQVLKNALIVPTGAKGGFVCKRLPDDPVAARADIRRQYIAFIGALLEVTDNLDADGTVVPPPGVIRHDGDDPYLVVAADKGTATFSDTANEVAESRGFWLGDAFASGGSSGYDHKELGITARGAWVVITRHFRELGVDLQTDPVRVVGVGDMSGDVFGNGMLLSRSLRLVAAFDHRDIFLDPEPDAEATHAERQRLFDTPGSTWQDHDRNVLSPGAMIVSRASKVVHPTPEVRNLLGLDDRPCTPDELMRAVLRCQVDLLWFGGIGTYVKASTESHADVGDRINDDIRVDATDLRARVIGEGANLAVTPKARVQYARRGGRVDQDAVHNAAGVDISDHEVNLKILLGLAEVDGRLERPARDALLADVAHDVVAHVLKDVDRQGALLSRLAAVSAERLEDLRTLLAALEAADVVNRAVDDLPDDDELAERAAAGAGLTRPELATLMAGAKRVISDALLDSSLPDDPTVAAAAASYFPARLLEEFGDLVPRHRLHRDLVATVATNDLVDRLGPVWPFHLAAETGASLSDVLAATLAAWHVVGGATWFDELDTVDEVLPPDRVQELTTDLARLVMAVSRRYLDDPLVPDVAAISGRDRAIFDAMLAVLPQTGSDTRQRQRRLVSVELTDNLVHPHLATLLSGTPELGLVVDVAATCRKLGAAPDVVTIRMLEVAAQLGLDRLGGLVERVRVAPEWERRERKGLAADVQRLHGIALRRALPDEPGPDLLPAPDLGLDPRRRQQVTGLLSRIDGMPDPPLPAVSVVVRAFADLLAR